MGLRDSPNPFKLLVFGHNVSGGLCVSTAPETIRATWDESVRIALAAESAGIEAIVPVSRWVGFGGASNHNDRSFETCTWAAGLAALTSKITIFSTVHVATIHPVRMAKEAVTVDHISKGRFGLNVVAGFMPEEIRMFGEKQVESPERYAIATEWMEIIQRIWKGEQFDFRGRYFSAEGAYGNPGPVDAAGPMIMNAGNSTSGSAFAASFADLNFINIFSLETAADQVTRVREAAREMSRQEVLVMAPTLILCRDTREEVDAYYDYMVRQKGDWEGARNIAQTLLANASSIKPDEKIVERIVLTYGGWPLIGTPDEIVMGMKQLADTGLDGITVSWPDFDDGLARYTRDLLPRMKEIGLRVA